MGRALISALILIAAGGLARADERIWYVYCDGYGHGMHWAVFSKNVWPHSSSDSYGRTVASRAEEFFEERHNLPLQGCSGVGFTDQDQANLSRQRTAGLHKRMGDQVHYFHLPDELLRE